MRAYEREVTSITAFNDRVKSKGITVSYGDVAILPVIYSQKSSFKRTTEFKICLVYLLLKTRPQYQLKARPLHIKPTGFLNTFHLDKIIQYL